MSAPLQHVKSTGWLGLVTLSVCLLHLVHDINCVVLGLLHEGPCSPNAEDLSFNVEELHNCGGLAHIDVSSHGLAVLCPSLVLRTLTWSL